MSGTITHKWEGTTLVVTSDSGTSSCDLKGDKGDIGIRGAQGATGVSIGATVLGKGQPEATTGGVGAFYLDTDANKLYFCNATGEWQEVKLQRMIKNEAYLKLDDAQADTIASWSGWRLLHTDTQVQYYVDSTNPIVIPVGNYTVVDLGNAMDLYIKIEHADETIEESLFMLNYTEQSFEIKAGDTVIIHTFVL